METEIKTIINILIHSMASLRTPQIVKKGMQNGHSKKGTTKIFEACTIPRLFFLLSGEVELNGEGIRKKALHKQTFTLLPTDISIYIEVLDDACYSLVHCHPFRNIHNKEYLKRIKGNNTIAYPPFSILPIRKTLNKLLHRSMIYMDDELSESPIFDALFTLMRTLYTTEELASIFHQFKISQTQMTIQRFSELSY